MKRMIYLLPLAVIFLSPVPNETFAGASKVEICHVNAANDQTYLQFGSIRFWFTQGRVISVAESAVDSHLAHGDAESGLFGTYPPETRDFFEETQGIRLPNGNCFFFSHAEEV